MPGEAVDLESNPFLNGPQGEIDETASPVDVLDRLLRYQQLCLFQAEDLGEQSREQVFRGCARQLPLVREVGHFRKPPVPQGNLSLRQSPAWETKSSKSRERERKTGRNRRAIWQR